MKPIFIIRYPERAKVEDLRNASESLARMGIYEDYHTLVIKDQFTDGEIKFECYNAPQTEIEFIELKNRIISLLDKI